nr:hypothetical protein [Tanacetum cinerariifolium]
MMFLLVVLVDEDEEPVEEEFKEEEDPQEEEDDMEVDIDKDENEPELTCPYEEVDPLKPLPPASESEPKDVTEAENLIEHEDETVPASIHETTYALVEKKGKAKNKYYGKLILDLSNEVRSSVEKGTTAMKRLVKKLGNAEDKAECKKLKKELEETRIMLPKSAPLTQAAIHRMIKENVDVAIATERARQANVRNDASAYGLVMGQDATPVGKKVKFSVATLQGPALTWWNAKPANLNEAVRMAHKLMQQKSQGRDERILEGKKRKWESFLGGNSSGKSNHKDNLRQTLQNNQKQGNARAMVTALIDGKVSSGSHPLCECCFTRHVGPCTIKYHKCGKVGHKARNRCTRRVKQEEVREVRGRAYAVKDAEPKGPNVVTGMFLLNNHYAFVLFDSGSDRSFVDTRFSFMLNIDPPKDKETLMKNLADKVKHDEKILNNQQEEEQLNEELTAKPKDKETLMKNLADKVKHDEKIPNNQQEEEQLNEELTAKADPKEVLGRKLWKEHSQDVIKNMHKLPKAT